MSMSMKMKLILVVAMLGSVAVNAGQIKPVVELNSPITNCAAVKLTSIQSGAGANLLGTETYNSTSCMGINGNDPQYGGAGDINIGLYGDGLLNGEVFNVPKVSDDYKFSTSAFAEPIFDPKLGIMKPGWIGLASVGSTIQYNNVNGDILSQYFKLDFWTGVDENTSAMGATSGNWRLTVFADAVTAAKKLLGDSYFDHLNIVLKGSNGFMAYNFNFNQIFGLHNAKPANAANQLSLSQYYTLAGAWDMQDFTNKNESQQGLSHATFAAHDPIDTKTVPAPAAFSLLGFGLMLLGFRLKNRR